MDGHNTARRAGRFAWRGRSSRPRRRPRSCHESDFPRHRRRSAATPRASHSPAARRDQRRGDRDCRDRPWRESRHLQLSVRVPARVAGPVDPGGARPPVRHRSGRCAGAIEASRRARGSVSGSAQSRAAIRSPRRVLTALLSDDIAVLESDLVPARRLRADPARSSLGPVAQLAEQQTLNLRVVGSIPTRLTTDSKPFNAR